MFGCILLLLLPSSGEACLFNCIELLREQLHQWQDTAAAAVAVDILEGLAVGSSSCSSSEAGGDHEHEDETSHTGLEHLPEASQRVSSSFMH